MAIAHLPSAPYTASNYDIVFYQDGPSCRFAGQGTVEHSRASIVCLLCTVDYAHTYIHFEEV